MIRITEAIYDEMCAHVKKGYPDECCGALIGYVERGREGAERKSVSDAIALTNINKERSTYRYEIDPVEILKIEKEVSKKGLSIVGYYHSHPDHTNAPSEFDRERAWPDYSYVILAVERGEKVTSKSWTFTEIRAPFSEEELSILYILI